MANPFVALGSALAFFGVALGAFGAHGLPLDAYELQIWETATFYHLAHAVALLAIGLARASLPSRLTRAAGYLIATGIPLFSGSLYALALTGTSWLGAVTPFGGACFLAGWAALALAATRRCRPLGSA